MPDLSLLSLGTFELTIDGEPENDLRNVKAQALLAYLATTRAPARREALMELLWPDILAQSAQGSLRQTLFKLRQVLPSDFLESDRQTIGISPSADYFFDVAAFEQLLQGEPTLAQLEEAVALYQGDFLQDFYLPDSNPFDLWVVQQREVLRQKMLAALFQLADLQQAAGAFEAAEETIRRHIALEPFSELAHQQLMQLLTAVGRRSEALVLYETFVAQLQEGLGVAPAAETVALVEQIRAGALSRNGAQAAAPETTRVVAPAQTAVSAIPNNLPASATPFIGRSQELATLETLLLDPEISLVTISGPGGMGKTRLALAVAEQFLQVETIHFPDGVYFLPLAPIRQTDQILPAILDIIDIPPDVRQETHHALLHATTPQYHLRHYWAKKQLFIVLDNFEHLLDGAATISTLLQLVPNVKVLITSRERLRLQGEQVFPIEGLTVPDLAAAEDPTAYASVRLFLQSARRVQPDFVLKPADLPHLAAICQDVAGMPLGLELAASWVDLLPLATIAAEIREGLDLLETELRDLPDRHRSIRAVFDHSWQQLAPDLQQIFAELSVFRGSFTREAAQSVTGASLRSLSTLVGKSLLHYRREADRYWLHRLLRQYGKEKLAGKTAVLQRHSQYFCRWLQEQEPHLKGAKDVAVIEQIERNMENIHLAWQTAVAHQDTAMLGEAVDGLFIFFVSHGRFLECLSYLGSGLAVLAEKRDEATQRVFLRMQLYRAHIHLSLEHVDEASAYLRSVAALMSELEASGNGSPFVFAMYKFGLAKLYANQQKMLEAQKLMLECLMLFDELGDQFWLDNVYLWLGQVAQALGNYDDARRWYGRSLELAQMRSNQRQQATALTSLGAVARKMENYAEARQHYDESYALAEANDDDWSMVRALENQAYLSLFLGDFAEATALLEKAIAQSQLVNNQFGLIYGQLNLGVVKWLLGEVETAVSLIKQSRQRSEVLAIPGDTSYIDASLAEVHAYLGRYDAAEKLALAARQSIYPSDQYTMGRINRILGWVAMGEGNNNAAYESFYASVMNYEVIDDQEYQALGLALLSWATAERGQLAEAQGHLFEALTTAVRIRAAIPLFTLLPLLGFLLAKSGEQARADVVLTAVFPHPFVQHSPLLRDRVAPFAGNVVADAPSDHRSWLGLAETAVSWLTDMGWGEKMIVK